MSIKILKLIFYHSPMILSMLILIAFLISYIRNGYIKVSSLLAAGLGILAYLITPLVLSLIVESHITILDKIAQGILHIIWIILSLTAIVYTYDENKMGFIE